MDWCTGRFLTLVKITMPKIRPSAQMARPIMSNVEPGMPRKLCELRSGTTSSASPAKAEPETSSVAAVAMMPESSAGRAELRLTGYEELRPRPGAKARVIKHHLLQATCEAQTKPKESPK